MGAFCLFRLLWVVLASYGCFWLVVGGFGVVLAGFDWFWLVSCFVTNAGIYQNLYFN